jgi:hypothetical protein
MIGSNEKGSRLWILADQSKPSLNGTDVIRCPVSIIASQAETVNLVFDALDYLSYFAYYTRVFPWRQPLRSAGVLA